MLLRSIIQFKMFFVCVFFCFRSCYVFIKSRRDFIEDVNTFYEIFPTFYKDQRENEIGEMISNSSDHRLYSTNTNTFGIIMNSFIPIGQRRYYSLLLVLCNLMKAVSCHFKSRQAPSSNHHYADNCREGPSMVPRQSTGS